MGQRDKPNTVATPMGQGGTTHHLISPLDGAAKPIAALVPPDLVKEPRRKARVAKQQREIAV